MSALDLAAFGLFLVCWLAYQPLLRLLARQRGGVINTDLMAIRAAWMRNMVARENRFMDGQLLGHALNSASFFASSNLILIAATAGALFGGESTFRSVSALEVIRTSSRFLFEFQLALVLVSLARGLLDFIWSIRQLNYALALIGAAPELHTEADRRGLGEAAGALLNPALSAFSQGVRGYYFALAAAAWLFGPLWLGLGVVAVFCLLVWRQAASPAARAIRSARRLLEP